MRPLLLIAGLAGLALATSLVLWQGFSVVFDNLAVAGWGLVVVALFHFLPMLIDTLGWRTVLRDPHRPSLPVMLWMLWIREAVDALLPFAQVGGQVVGTRFLMIYKVRGAAAGASVVLELTLSVLTQLIFTLMGLVLLLVLIKQESGLTLGVLAGLSAGAICIYGFIEVQRRGLFQMLVRWLSALAGGRRWLSLVGGAGRLDASIKALYQCPGTLIASGSWLLLSWFVGVGEVWLALYFMDQPVGLLQAILLESLGRAVRSASFMIPGSLGVQEGGFMVLGAVLGLGPQIGLTVSLAKRVRELLLGIPALIAWQWIEGRRLCNGGAQGSESANIR